MKRLLPIVPTLLLLLVPSLARSGADRCIDVVIEGVRNADGLVRLALFADEASYDATANARHLGSLPATEGTVRSRICGLEAGRYGLSVFHDEDSDLTLDATRLGIPREGYGFSGGARGRTGRPSFKKIAFELPAEGTHTETIRLLYWF